MQAGFLVVFAHGKDSTIYTIDSIDTKNQIAKIKNYTQSGFKDVSLNNIREALDEELLIGFRLNTKGS